MKKIYYIPLLLLLLNSLSIAQDGWEDLNVPMEHGRTVMAHAVIYDEVYLIGGSLDLGTVNVATNSVVRFDLTQLNWSTDPVPPAMLHNRIGATAVEYYVTFEDSVHEYIFVFGGKNEDGEYVEDIEYYYPGSPSWEVVGQLTPAREGLRAFVYGDTMYVSGGGRGTLGQYKRIDRVCPTFDTTTNILSSVSVEGPSESTLNPSLPSERTYHSITMHGEKAYLFGGRYSIPMDDAYFWSLLTREWQETSHLPEMASGVAICSLNVNTIALSGGRGDTSELFSLSFYNTDADTFEAPNLDNDFPIGRTGHAMISYENNLFSFGGSFYDSDVGLVTLPDVLKWDGSSVDVEKENDHSVVPDKLHLSAYPNPSNGDVTIDISSNILEKTSVAIYNVLGQLVKTWKFESISKVTKLSWNGFANNIAVPGGVYFVVVEQASKREVIKLLRLP
jgi:Secretion system C-terminal sorting domain/Galactose oxidase, central domain